MTPYTKKSSTRSLVLTHAAISTLVLIPLSVLRGADWELTQIPDPQPKPELVLGSTDLSHGWCQVLALKISEDNSLLESIATDGTYLASELPSGRETFRARLFTRPDETIVEAAFAGPECRLATYVTTKSGLFVLDLDLKTLRSIDLPGFMLRSLRTSPDGTECALLSKQGNVRLFRISEGRPFFEGKIVPEKEIKAVAYGTSGALWALFDGGKIGLLQTSGTLRPDDPVEPGTIPLVGWAHSYTPLLVDERNQTVVSGNSEGALQFHDLQTGEVASVTIAADSSIHRIVPLNTVATRSVTVLTDRGLFQCEGTRPHQVRRLKTGRDFRWDAFTMSPDGSTLAAGTRQGLFVYSLSEDRQLAEVASPKKFFGPPSTCFGSESGLSALTADGVLRLWSRGGQVIRQTDLSARLVSASPGPDKDSVIAGDARGNAHFLIPAEDKWTKKWSTQLNPRGLTPYLAAFGSTDFYVHTNYHAEPNFVTATTSLGRIHTLRTSDGMERAWYGLNQGSTLRCRCYCELLNAVVTTGYDVQFQSVDSLRPLQSIKYFRNPLGNSGERDTARDIQPVGRERMLAIAGNLLHSLDGLARPASRPGFPIIHDSRFLFMAVSSDRRLVACSDQHDHIFAFDTKTGKQIHSINCHQLVLSLAFESGAENHRLIAGLSDGRVCVWNLDEQ